MSLHERKVLKIICKNQNILPLLTLEQPGVKAPGTPNMITFLLDVNSQVLILLAGESSNKSTDGILSPTLNNIMKFINAFV